MNKLAALGVRAAAVALEVAAEFRLIIFWLLEINVAHKKMLDVYCSCARKQFDTKKKQKKKDAHRRKSQLVLAVCKAARVAVNARSRLTKELADRRFVFVLLSSLAKIVHSLLIRPFNVIAQNTRERLMRDVRVERRRYAWSGADCAAMKRRR